MQANVDAYPERCAGPARIAPLLNEAFAAGQTGEGDSPMVEKARVQAALLWFLHLSVYKEANTCVSNVAKDCDSSWAYYTGGNDRSGGIGLSGEVRRLSELAHNRIWDGFSAFRCWREQYPEEMFPTIADVDEAGQALYEDADAQLDAALWYGWSRLVRERLEQQINTCGTPAEANWAWLQIAGPVLSEEAERLDPQANASLAALWSGDIPDEDTVRAAVDTIDAIFGCP